MLKPANPNRYKAEHKQLNKHSNVVADPERFNRSSQTAEQFCEREDAGHGDRDYIEASYCNDGSSRLDTECANAALLDHDDRVEEVENAVHRDDRQKDIYQVTVICKESYNR